MTIGKSRAPAHESRVFQPSSFASRKAERASRGELAPRPQRLVSVGITETWLEGLGPRRKGQLARVELLVDIDTRKKFQRHLPNGTVEPLIHVSNDPPPEPLGVITGHGISSGPFPPSLPDQPAQPIA